jgi:catechol 2,3-dioxygenase-like lactoylglutathione lyase family enzyme
VELQGLGYPTIICKDMQQSLEFYSKLGMKHLYTEPNRDDAESVQALLHAGGDTYLMLVGPTHEGVNIAEASPGIGSMQYLTLQVTTSFIDQAYFELSSAGIHGSEEIRRGYERLVFLEDPSGVLIALVAWGTEPPPNLTRAEVLAKAGELKDSEGVPFIEEEHIQRAIAELGD